MVRISLLTFPFCTVSLVWKNAFPLHATFSTAVNKEISSIADKIIPVDTGNFCQRNHTATANDGVGMVISTGLNLGALQTTSD